MGAARHQGGYAPADRRAANRRSGIGRPGAQQENQRRAAQQPQVFQPCRQSQQSAHRHPVGAGGKAVQALHRGVQSRKAVQKPRYKGVDAVEQHEARRGESHCGGQLSPVDPGPAQAGGAGQVQKPRRPLVGQQGQSRRQGEQQRQSVRQMKGQQHLRTAQKRRPGDHVRQGLIDRRAPL